MTEQERKLRLEKEEDRNRANESGKEEDKRDGKSLDEPPAEKMVNKPSAKK